SLSTRPPPTPPSTLSLHDALPISHKLFRRLLPQRVTCGHGKHESERPHRGMHPKQLHDDPPRGDFSIIRPSWQRVALRLWWSGRSEEHTSELQSLRHLVCRLLLEK